MTIMTELPVSPMGSNALRSRAFNRALVLGHLRRAHRAGRAAIARETGLSTQAVSNIIADLVQDGWLREAGKLSRGRGLPAVQYALQAGAGSALGIEIRPGAILAALTDLDGQIQFSHRARLDRATPAVVAKFLHDIKVMALNAPGVRRVIGAGVVMPGPFGATGLSGAGSDLPGWADTDAQALIAEALDLPVRIENDASAAAMAEMIAGRGQGVDDFAYLYFGTGIGLGVISGRVLVRGARGNAGEIGHIGVPQASGCAPLEQIASRMALRQRLADTGIVAETSDRLEALFAVGNPVIAGWLTDAADALGHALHIIENLYDPDTVIAGGAMPAPLLEALIARVDPAPQSVANRPDRSLPRLICGRCGPLTATLGAAALVINDAFTPRMAAAL